MFGIPGGQNYRREARRGLREFPGVRHTRDTPFARASCAPYGPARPTIIRANEFRNFAGADVIWDNAHIALLAQILHASRLSLSRDNGELPLPSMRSLSAKRLSETPRRPEKPCQHFSGTVVVIYYNASRHTFLYFLFTVQRHSYMCRTRTQLSITDKKRNHS